MDLKSQNIMFFLRAPQFGGTEAVVLQLCKILKPYVNNIIVVCSKKGMKIQELNELKIKLFDIPDIENKSLAVILSLLNKLSKIIRNENISVIHTHHRMAAFYTSILKFKYNFVFINTSHNTFYNKKYFTHIALKTANKIACGNIVKQNLVDIFGFSENQITVIHNAVEPFNGKITLLDDLTRLKNNGYFIVGSVGRLSEQKGMEYFILSYLQVQKICPNVKYVIIGDGEKKEDLKRLVESLNISHNIIFLGYQENVRNIMSQMDLLVLSSLWEGFPLTPIEAFSVGKTIIATAVDGTIEIVTDGKNGYLVPAKDELMLADKIIKLIQSETLRKNFENEARKTYINNFSYEKYKEDIINYYLKI